MALVVVATCAGAAPLVKFAVIAPAGIQIVCLPGGLATAAIAAVTNAVVANCVVLVPGAAVGPPGVPVNVGEASGAPPAPVTSAVVNVTAPVRVLNDDTPPDGMAAIAAVTNAVVAICVVFVLGAAVGAAGVPVNVGELISAPPAAEMSALVSV